MKPLDKIYQEIKNDPMNQVFTAQKWEPIYMAYAEAKILIIGQAPGLKTQTKGVVFQDKSGENLRRWLNVDADTFYHSKQIAVFPLDFYFPGKGKTGDLPPRIAFADKWHPQIIAQMPHIKLIILIGRYAQKYYLKQQCKKNLSETVKAYKDYLPNYFVLVHPSPLNFRWLHNNPYFQNEVLPCLQKIVEEILHS